MRKVFNKMSTLMAGLALLITAGAVNSVCCMFLHQPELPEGADSLRRK